jgi:hypothetical protein
MFIREHMQQLSVSDVFVAHARLFRQKISQSILVNFAKGFISSTLVCLIFSIFFVDKTFLLIL